MWVIITQSLPLGEAEVDQYAAAGEVLIEIDPEPFRVAVQRAESDLQLARADLEQARAQVRSQLATAHRQALGLLCAVV